MTPTSQVYKIKQGQTNSRIFNVADYMDRGLAAGLAANTAITEAKAFTVSGNKAIIEFPAGNFTAEVQIVGESLIHIRGQGMGITTLTAAAGLNMSVIKFTAKVDFRVSDMSVDGNKAAQTQTITIPKSGVEVDGCQRATVEQVDAYNCFTDGIDVTGLSKYVNVLWCKGHDNESIGVFSGNRSEDTRILFGEYYNNGSALGPDAHGIFVDGNCDLQVTSKRVLIHGNKVYDNNGPTFGGGIFLVELEDSTVSANWVYNNGPDGGIILTDGADGARSKGNILTGNYVFNNPTTGILVSGHQNFEISDNHIYGNTQYGISVSNKLATAVCNNIVNIISKNFKIHGNRVYSNLRNGIEIDGDATTGNIVNPSVRDNIVYDNGINSAPSPQCGIRISRATEIDVGDNFVFDTGSNIQNVGFEIVTASGLFGPNHSVNHSLANYSILTSPSLYAVEDSKFSDLGNITGAVSLDRRNAAVFKGTLTGNVTLTINANVTKGEKLTAIFVQDGTGSRTLSTGTTVVFAQGLPMLSTAAGAVDIYTFIFDGTNWRESSRSKPAISTANRFLTTTGNSGTAANPAYSFTDDPDTGWYDSAANTLSASTNGVLRLSIDTAAITSTLPYIAPAGTGSAAAFTTAGDLNTGLFFPAADFVALTANGTTGVQVSASDVTLSGTTRINNFLAFVGTPQSLTTSGVSSAVNVTTANTDITMTTAADVATLAAGTEGQIKIITIVVDGAAGNGLTITPNAGLGFTTIVFTAAGANIGDSVTLEYLGAKWRVLASRGNIVIA